MRLKSFFSASLKSLVYTFISLALYGQNPGATSWKYNFKEVDGVACGYDETIYVVGGRPKQLFALNSKTGIKKWVFATDYTQFLFSSPTVGPNGTVYFGGVFSPLYAINGATGIKKWECETGGLSSPPAVGENNVVYTGSVTEDAVYAINGQTGVTIWKFRPDFNNSTLKGGFSSPAIAYTGSIYIGCYDGFLYAINSKTGAKIWKFKPEDSVSGGSIALTSGSPAIGSDGTVYVGSNKNLYALEGSTGVAKWKSTLDGSICASPTIGVDGTIYTGTDRGVVYALNGETGSKKWQFTASGIITSPTVGADGTVYAGAYNYFYALDGATGSKKWRIGSAYSSPKCFAINPNGLIYVNIYTVESGTSLHALVSSSMGLAGSPWPKVFSNNLNNGLVNYPQKLVSLNRMGDNKINIQLLLVPRSITILESSTNLSNWVEQQRFNGPSTTGISNVNLSVADEKSRVLFWRTRFE